MFGIQVISINYCNIHKNSDPIAFMTIAESYKKITNSSYEDNNSEKFIIVNSSVHTLISKRLYEPLEKASIPFGKIFEYTSKNILIVKATSNYIMPNNNNFPIHKQLADCANKAIIKFTIKFEAMNIHYYNDEFDFYSIYKYIKFAISIF